ncbi:MAG: hypothetical protein FJY92_05230, partial [Candidatus Hydrogenedentes bacterium]|nr:hypothetical protein [Candidatus Hydrogenedentota bacterium]
MNAKCSAICFVLCVAAASGCGGQPAPEQTAPATPVKAEPRAHATATPAAAKKPKYPAGTKRGRVVILGFDGVEPAIVDAMFAANELPNLAKLRDEGSYRRLTSAIPPQSPSAWSSFTTCTNTGAHGVYDFVTRNPAKYFPQKGFGSAEHAELDPEGKVTRPARFDAVRKGHSFWKEADSQGLKTTSLMVPFAFPAEDLAQGCMLCGLGVTDIRCTDSTFFSFSDTYEKNESVSGGMLVPLKFEGNVATAMVPGARDPRKKYGTPEAFVQAPIEFTVNRAANTVSIKTPSETLNVKKEEWSKWIEWSFDVSPQFAVKAISRFYVLDAGENVNVYMACLQFDPKAPYIRFSTPETFAGDLKDRYGLFKTIGWTYDTHALRRGALTDDAFLVDVAQTMAFHERLMLDEFDRGNDMLVAAWTGPDRVSHMFWRFRDPKHPLYTEDGAAKYGRA